MTTADDQKKRLDQHITHRLLASLAQLPLREEILDAPDDQARQRTRELSDYFALHQGRLDAIRWLIEFVGVKSDDKGKPRRYSKKKPTDILISDFSGGKEIELSSPEAKILAELWLGCSQASAHATDRRNHTRVDDPALQLGIRILEGHLQRTIYSAAGQDLRQVLVQAAYPQLQVLEAWTNS